MRQALLELDPMEVVGQPVVLVLRSAAVRGAAP